MNVRKLWRKMARGDQFYPSEALEIRRLIGQSLVTFFSLLKEDREKRERENAVKSQKTGV